MSFTFDVKDKTTAPQAGKEILEGVEKAYGFIPNLFGVLAAAPPAAEAYRTLNGLFSQTSLSATEQQVVLLTVSYENECTYCVAAHTVIAGMQKVPQDVVDAVRDGTPLADARLEALRRFTAEVVTTRGWPSEDAKRAFAEAGYTEANYLEVVLGVALKTLSNYANHAADTPLDAAFQPGKWDKAA